MSVRIDILRAGRSFYHGRDGEPVMASRPIWVTTGRETAFVFGNGRIYRLLLLRDLRVARFDGKDGYLELAELLGIEPDDDDLRPAAAAFCRVFAASPYGLDGWHMPSFYGQRQSDTLVCDARAFSVVDVIGRGVRNR